MSSIGLRALKKPRPELSWEERLQNEIDKDPNHPLAGVPPSPRDWVEALVYRVLILQQLHEAKVDEYISNMPCKQGTCLSCAKR